MTKEDIYIIAKAWIEKDHENSSVDWVKLMADDLSMRFKIDKKLSLINFTDYIKKHNELTETVNAYDVDGFLNN